MDEERRKPGQLKADRSLFRSPHAGSPYFIGNLGYVSRPRKPVRVIWSDEGSNPSLSVSRQVRAFLPHGLAQDRPPARAFQAPTSPRPPLVQLRSGHHITAITTPILSPARRVLIRSRQRGGTPPLLEGSTSERSPARAPRGVVRLTSPQLPPPPRWACGMGSSRAGTSLYDRRTAGHPRVARRSPARGIPQPVRPNNSAQPGAQVLTEREVPVNSAASPPGRSRQRHSVRSDRRPRSPRIFASVAVHPHHADSASHERQSARERGVSLTLPGGGAASRPPGEWEVRADARAETRFHLAGLTVRPGAFERGGGGAGE